MYFLTFQLCTYLLGSTSCNLRWRWMSVIKFIVFLALHSYWQINFKFTTLKLKTRSPGKFTLYPPYKTMELITKTVKLEIMPVLVTGRWRTETHIICQSEKVMNLDALIIPPAGQADRFGTPIREAKLRDPFKILGWARPLITILTYILYILM